MEQNYGKQIGVITFGGDKNFYNYAIAMERANGHVIVFCNGYARIHAAK